MPMNANGRNMKCCRTKQLLDPFPLAMDFGLMLELEYADFHKTLEGDRAPPKAMTIIIATTRM